MKKKINLVCIDSEGGHGGASKSLMITLKKVDRHKFDLFVICKKKSWIEKVYKKEGINCKIIKNIPTFTVLDKISRNLYTILYFLFIKWPSALKFRQEIRVFLLNADIVHLNHINQFIIAIWIKLFFPKIKISMHLRTMPYKNLFSYYQHKLARMFVDSFICITENEYSHFTNILKDYSVEKNIIFNSMENIEVNKNKYSYLRKTRKLIIGSYSNYSFYRGTDRIILLASELPKNILDNILFVISGDTSISLGDWKRNKYLSGCSDLKDYAKKLGVQSNFLFLGHIKNTEEVIINSDLTLKLTREFNPWGRDIIESMFYKVPVISIGMYDVFIKNNYSGILLEDFKVEKLVHLLKVFINNRKSLKIMGNNAKKIIINICNSRKNSLKLEKVWKKML